MAALENVETLHSAPGQAGKRSTEQRSALFELTLSPEDTATIPTLAHSQPRKTSDPMAKTKRRMFSTPLLRRSATASGAAAASAASRIKSMTKLPTVLKRSSTNKGQAAAPAKEIPNKATVARAPTVSSLSTVNADAKLKTQHSRKFGIQSLMRIKTSSKDTTHAKPMTSPVLGPLDSPEPQTDSEHSTETSEAETVDETPAQKSSSSNASRFVSRMPAMLKRVVSTGHTTNASINAAAPMKTKKASPDTSANSTPRGEFSDEPDEDTRRSLLMMMQVPEALRRSQLPLMAVSEAW